MFMLFHVYNILMESIKELLGFFTRLNSPEYSIGSEMLLQLLLDGAERSTQVGNFNGN